MIIQKKNSKIQLYTENGRAVASWIDIESILKPGFYLGGEAFRLKRETVTLRSCVRLRSYHDDGRRPINIANFTAAPCVSGIHFAPTVVTWYTSTSFYGELDMYEDYSLHCIVTHLVTWSISVVL